MHIGQARVLENVQHTGHNSSKVYIHKSREVVHSMDKFLKASINWLPHQKVIWLEIHAIYCITLLNCSSA